MIDWLHLPNESIIVILILLFSLDIFATNKCARFLKKHKPDMKYDEFEMNPIQVILWNKFGVNPGSLIMGIFQVIGVSLIYAFFPRDLVMTLIGMEMLVAMIHITNLRFIIKKEKADEKKANNVAAFNNESLF
jgi:hypothetical protein